VPASRPIYKPTFNIQELHEALELVRQLDPPGVACRDLRECLLYQLRYIQQQHQQQKNGNGTSQVLADALAIVDQHLRAVQMKQLREIAKAIGRPIEAIPAALEFIKTLDPRPGQQYNKATTRLIEPDVAFIKHGDEWLCLMNDDERQRHAQLRERALQERHPAHQEHRAAQADHHESLLLDRRAPAGFP
jgi:RNA polymerase sigma-54 factor